MEKFSSVPSVERLNGSLPKIGVRAIIDGRRNGVREALEEKTMQLTHAVAQLIKETLRYPNGLPVDTIVSPGTIGGVSEAVRCSDFFRQENVCAILDISYAWAYAAEILEMDPFLPKAIWGFNGSERPGSVYLAGAIAAAEQKGLPIFKIYGNNVQDSMDISIPNDVAEKILRFARSAVSVGYIRGKSYLSMGGVSMGIGGSIIESALFQSYFGMRNESVDMSEFTRRIECGIYDPAAFKRACKWVKMHCQEMEDPNPAERRESREKKDQNWETVIKMTLIGRDLMIGNPALAELGYQEEAEGHNACVAGFQGQRQWTDYFPNGDFMEAILNSSFDWDGIRQPFIIATENDSLNGLTMLLGHCLTGSAQIFADVRTYWSPQAVSRVTGTELSDRASGGFLYLTNSGAAALDGCGEMEQDGNPVIKPHWEISSEEALKCVQATKWGSAKLASFRGGGFSSSYQTRGEMPMTMARLNLVKGLGPVLQLVEGWAVNLPENIEKPLVARTDPTWPRTYFVPRLSGTGACEDVYSVMNNWGSNHCVLSYGHTGEDWLTLSSMFRIPVCFHNIDRARIFRPAAWVSFGTNDLESADFRACEAYGPLYGSY